MVALVDIQITILPNSFCTLQAVHTVGDQIEAFDGLLEIGLIS